MTEAVPAFLPRNLRQRRKGSGTNCFRLHRTMKAAIWLRVLMLEQREYRTDAETFAAIDLDAAAGDECRAFTEQPDDRRTDQIGGESCRVRVFQNVWISVVAESVKKTKKNQT